MVKKTDLTSVYGFSKDAIKSLGLPDKTCITAQGGYTAKLYSFERVIDFVKSNPQFNWDAQTLPQLIADELSEQMDRLKWVSDAAIADTFSRIHFADPLPSLEQAIRGTTKVSARYYFEDYISSGALHDHIIVSYSNYRLVINQLKREIKRSYLFYELKYKLRHMVTAYIASMYPPPDEHGNFKKLSDEG